MLPLKKIRVLDMSRVLAGPWAGQIFADLGAEVIKIERPGTGDDTRTWGPPFLKDLSGSETNEAGYYLSINRGKKSVALDFRTPAGQEVLKRMASECYILIENYKVGGLKKYGLDYNSLKKSNPGLIYLSITGFGQFGPYSKRAGYDLIIQAMGGLMSVTGERDDLPGGGPQKVGIAISDLFCGIYGVIGALAALHRRKETGTGTHVDMALLDTMVSVMHNQNMSWLIGGALPRRYGNEHAAIVPYAAYKTRDGDIIVAVGNDHQYAEFAAVLGDSRLLHENYRTNPERVRHRDSLFSIIREVMKTRDTADWLKALEPVGVPAGPINTVDKTLEDPQLLARGMRVELEHPLSGTVPSVMNPFTFDGQISGAKTAPPLLGQHTHSVLTAFGFSRDEILSMDKDGIIQLLDKMKANKPK